MQDRYTLRFESGERAGEVVSLTGTLVTVGRKPDNSLQIAESSVSGQHAQLRIEDSGVLLVDNGSTNGTRVGDERVTERRLAHGDRVSFGSVTLVFQDGQLAAAAPPAAGQLPDDDHDDVHSISAANLERAGKRSKLGLVVLLLALVGGGGAAWWFLKGEGGGTRRVDPVVPVAGNLLSDTYSFEGELTGWVDAEEVEAAFLQRPSAAHTGEQGMRAQLEGGERARLLSPSQRPTKGRSYELTAQLRAEDGASGRLGVLFHFGGTEGQVPGDQVAWSDWCERDAGWLETSLRVAVPAGATSAEVVIEAHADAGGTVDVDDVVLLEASGAADPAESYRDFQAWLLGEPAQALAIRKVDHALISDLSCVDPTQPITSFPLELVADGEEFRLRFAGSGSSRVLTLVVEPAALDGGIASLGEGGRKTHGAQFDRSDVDSLLLGKGFDLMRLHFDTPVTIEGRPEGDGVRVNVLLGSNDGAAFEVDFHAETAAARGLAEKARKAESENRMGDAYAAWRELRDVYPYDESLLSEAEASMQRIAQGGLDALVEVRENVERARFFRLHEGYVACREQAVGVGERYAGSVVETEALALVAEIDELASGLETDLAADEVRRLRGILKALEASESPALAAEVKNYLETTYGVRD